jgi:hypothetical protein
MNTTTSLLTVVCPELPDSFPAGAWVPITVLLSCPADAAVSVKVRHLGCLDPSVQLDLDLLQRDVEIRPGESYHLTFRCLVPSPRMLQPEAFQLQIADSRDVVRFPAHALTFGANLEAETSLALQALCAYDEGTRVRLTLTHTGTQTFHDLRLQIGSPGCVVAGKNPVHRVVFAPGDSEQLELVVKAEQLHVLLSATAQGQPTRWERDLVVPRLPAREQRPIFRFLEPRRLANDAITIEQHESGQAVRAERGDYPLVGGEQYLITIKPQHPNATAVRLREIPGIIHVRESKPNAVQKSWSFLVEVQHNDLLSKPERLLYDVETPEGAATGQIHLRLMPPSGRLWRFALTLTAGVLIHGLIAVGSVILSPEALNRDWLSEFNPSRDWSIFSPFGVPLIYAGMRVLDHFLYRLRR